MDLFTEIDSKLSECVITDDSPISAVKTSKVVLTDLISELKKRVEEAERIESANTRWLNDLAPIGPPIIPIPAKMSWADIVDGPETKTVTGKVSPYHKMVFPSDGFKLRLKFSDECVSMSLPIQTENGTSWHVIKGLMFDNVFRAGANSPKSMPALAKNAPKRTAQLAHLPFTSQKDKFMNWSCSVVLGQDRQPWKCLCVGGSYDLKERAMDLIDDFRTGNCNLAKHRLIMMDQLIIHLILAKMLTIEHFVHETGSYPNLYI